MAKNEKERERKMELHTHKPATTKADSEQQNEKEKSTSALTMIRRNSLPPCNSRRGCEKGKRTRKTERRN
jgi:hypothetical protein